MTPDPLAQAVERLEEACKTFNPMKVWERDFATTSLTPAWDACAADFRLVLSALTRLTAERDAAVGGLEKISKQHTTDELRRDDMYGDADFEGGWDHVIEVARAILAQLSAHSAQEAGEG